MKKIGIALSISALLTACGGGAGEFPNDVKLPLPTPVLAFVTSSQLLPDLKTKYDKLCGPAANMQNAIPVD